MNEPDERREPPLAQVDVMTITDTESCEVPHTGYLISDEPAQQYAAGASSSG